MFNRDELMVIDRGLQDRIEALTPRGGGRQLTAAEIDECRRLRKVIAPLIDLPSPSQNG